MFGWISPFMNAGQRPVMPRYRRGADDAAMSAPVADRRDAPTSSNNAPLPSASHCSASLMDREWLCKRLEAMSVRSKEHVAYQRLRPPLMPSAIGGPQLAITCCMIGSTERTTRGGGAGTRRRPAASRQPSMAALRCRRKFLRFFRNGFGDETYIDWERNYKLQAHERWTELLSPAAYSALLRDGEYREAARRAVTIESRTNLLFSFEKMALRDAVRSPAGARAFAEGLYAFLHGGSDARRAFEAWCGVLAQLPRRQTRVLTWPLATVFGFLAQPRRHIFLKPNVTRIAARAYQYDFSYVSTPGWDTYASLLGFADRIRCDQRDLRPRDMIDLQSFIWVQGSDEYDE